MTPWRILISRAALLIAAVSVWIAVVFAFSATSANEVFVVTLTDGVVPAMWILGCFALGQLLLWKLIGPPLLKAVSSAAVGFGVFSLLGLGLGLAGALCHATALALPTISILLWLAANFGANRDWVATKPALSLDPVKRWLTEPAGVHWLWLIAVVSLAMACVGASAFPGLLWKPLDPHPYDVVSYHLQVPREWYELGRIVPLRHNVFSYLPFNVELHYLLLMHALGGPWAAMYACQFLNVGLGVLTVLAVAGSMPGGRGVVAAVMLVSVPWVVMLSCVAYVEIAFLLFSTLSLGWLLQSWSGDANARARWWPIMLAGVFTGFAAGVKLTALPMLLLPAALGIIVTHRGTRRSILRAVVFASIALLVLSPWLIRNFVWAGNPLFPLAMNVLGRAHFSAEQVLRFKIAHSARLDQSPVVAKFQSLWTGVLTQWQFGFALLPVALVLLFRRSTTALFLAINAGVVLIVWMFFTHLQPRFAVSLLPVAALAVAMIPNGRFARSLIVLPLMAAFAGFVPLWSTLATQIGPVVAGNLFGIETLNFATLDDVHRLDPANDKSVALVGDASAFLVQLPMNRLRYRTVFDLPANVTDPVDAWAGPGVRGNPAWLLAINPPEIQRLHATYRDVPDMPLAYPVEPDRPSVVPATAVP